MSDKQKPAENPSQSAHAAAQKEDLFALPHSMIARTFSDYLATLYDIYDFSSLPCTSDELFLLKLEGADEKTVDTLKKILSDIRGMEFDSPVTIDEDVVIFGFETLEEFVPLLKTLDDMVMQTVFDQKQSDAQALPHEDTLLKTLRQGSDPFICYLVSDDRAYFSDAELVANMLKNFKTVAGMTETYITPAYSISLIERAIYTANNPASHSAHHFRLH